MADAPLPPAPPPNAPPSVPKEKSGMRAALEYTGIPPSLFEKRPRLPGRNWLIFIGVTSTVVGYYVYDRRECRRIREDYKARVRWLADEPLGSLEHPRRVTVYGAKWPGDEDWDRSTRYFRKYVKPVLHAAAIDYEIIAGKRHGDLATRVQDDIIAQRRLAAGMDEPLPAFTPLALQSTLDQRLHRALGGGTVLVGRPAFKEYMAGLKRGWTGSVRKVDREEAVAAELADDGRFDEREPEPSEMEKEMPVGEGEPIPTQSRLPPSRPSVFNPVAFRAPPSPSQKPAHSEQDIPPPDQIPPQPPLLLVPFVNNLGIAQIPNMIWDFFNERYKVKDGAEAAYRLVMHHTRPFFASPRPDSTQPGSAASDLDFAAYTEAYYKGSTADLPADIQKAREAFYAALPEKLATARALARGEREPTKDERDRPPPTEVELRAERLKKEVRWRGDERGWEIVKPESPVEWDERFEGALRVFTDPPRGAEAQEKAS